MSKVNLRKEDVEQIVNTLIYDGDVDMITPEERLRKNMDAYEDDFIDDRKNKRGILRRRDALAWTRKRNTKTAKRTKTTLLRRRNERKDRRLRITTRKRNKRKQRMEKSSNKKNKKKSGTGRVQRRDDD